MSSDENQPLQFLGKHRSPIDVADEEEPKRRKHHHHHHQRHRRNRHRSRHGGDRDEGGNLYPTPEAATGPSAVDDEMEEGEILEDEDDFDSRHNPIGGNFGLDDVVKLSGKGIEEEGRYKGVGEDEGRRDRSRSPVSSKRNTKRQKRSHDEEVLENSGKHEHNEARHGARSTAHSHTKNDSNRENGRGDDVVHPRTQETNKRDLREREKGTGDGRDCSRRGGGGERKGNYENSEDRDGVEAGKVSHREIERGKIERGDKHGSLGRDHEKGRHGTAGDEDHRERERNRSYKEHDEVDVRHDNRGGVRESEEYRCRTNKQSYGKRDESNSLSRHDVQEEDKHSGREREREHGRDASARDGAHTERRSAGYSRHDEKGDGHGNWGRDQEREGCWSSRNRDRDIIEVGKRSTEERGREREGCWSSRDRDRDRVEVGKRSLGERERSSSYSRHDVHVHRSSSRDGDRERGIDIAERDRDGKRPRDASRDRHGERESVKDAYFERERGRSGSGRDKARTSDIEMHIRQDRERERHSSKDRQRIKFKELAKEGSFARKTSNKDEKPTREEDEDYEEKILEQLAKQEEDDVDKIKEESRKRREAILAKYRQRQALQAESGSIDAAKEDKTDTDMGKPEELNDLVAICKVSNKALENGHDPSDLCNADPSFALGKSPVLNGVPVLEKTAGAGGLGEGTPKSERSADMFCDDIFGESPTGVRKKGKSDILQIEKSGLHDNWDDVEGYYSYRFGEVLDGRYEVVAAHGKGVFSTVVRAKDLKAGKGDPEEVAIKIIRNNETMYKAGLGELTILKKLAGADPDDRRHCVRFLSSLKYRNHLCLVFESLHMNLREVLKKFGRNIGLKLTAVRAYAKQLFIALKHLRNCGILHCDIKPDNMLVNEAKNVLKLCDFGNAMFSGKNEITPYLVSRFYRAPEIILGLPYDHPMDIWSVGCCLYELYTGKVLFPGPSNNDMLRLHMELKGLFPKKMLRKGAFTDQHFDQDLNFLATEEDPVTKKTVKRLLLNIKPRDIGALISGSPGEDLKMLANFRDLLDRIFVLDPEKRMTVSQALSHPFITGK